MTDVRDNPGASRFELQEQGLTAVADYRRHGDTLLITHVESPMALRGQGTAARLMSGLLDEARARGLKVQPLCSYAVAYMRRNPQYEDLRA